MALRLATFNVQDLFLARRDEEHAVVEAKVAALAATLRRARADVVALQEVGSPELIAHLVDVDAADLGYLAPVVGSADARGIRNVLLSRLPILLARVHHPRTLSFPRFVDGDPEPFAGRLTLRRGVVHARVRTPTFGEVDVLTAHFKSGRPTRRRTRDGAELPDSTCSGAGESAIRSELQRVAEALHVRSLIDDLFAAEPAATVCFMGDMNDSLDSLPVRVVRGIDAASPQHLRVAAGSSIPPERLFSCHHGETPILIDHILLSGRLHDALRGLEIHNEALQPHGSFVEEMAMRVRVDSDHALCVAEVGE